MTTITRPYFVPRGGAVTPGGQVLNKKQVTAAVAKFARRHGFYARTVRTVTALFIAALAMTDADGVR